MTIDKVKEIIAGIIGKNVEEINDETKLVDDLGFDSIDGLQLIVELENEFGVFIEDEETADIVTVSDATKKIDDKLANK